MRAFLGLIIAALLGLSAWQAEASITTTGAGKVPGGAQPPTYTGPGDVVSGAKAFYGLRAYTAAKATANAQALKVINSSTSETCDVLLASGGGLGNVASCSGSGSGTAASFCSTNCLIETFYDQTGNTFNADCPVSQRPALLFNCIGSLPCAVANGVDVCTVGATTTNQPLTITAVANCNSPCSGQQDILTASVGAYFNFDMAATYSGYFGAVFEVAATAGSWHAVNEVANGPGGATSSIISVDGSNTTGDLGSIALDSDYFLFDQRSTTFNPLTGKVTEIGLWATNFSTGQLTSMNSNQHAYWGF